MVEVAVLTTVSLHPLLVRRSACLALVQKALALAPAHSPDAPSTPLVGTSHGSTHGKGSSEAPSESTRILG